MSARDDSEVWGSHKVCKKYNANEVQWARITESLSFKDSSAISESAIQKQHIHLADDIFDILNYNNCVDFMSLSGIKL